MFSVDEVARRLSVARNTVLRLVFIGKLKAVKVGKQYRISEEALADFLIQNEVRQDG